MPYLNYNMKAAPKLKKCENPACCNFFLARNCTYRFCGSISGKLGCRYVAHIMRAREYSKTLTSSRRRQCVGTSPRCSGFSAGPSSLCHACNSFRYGQRTGVCKINSGKFRTKTFILPSLSAVYAYYKLTDNVK